MYRVFHFKCSKFGFPQPMHNSVYPSVVLFNNSQQSVQFALAYNSQAVGLEHTVEPPCMYSLEYIESIWIRI